MFHEGDLQSGISKALEKSKLVACFVTDDDVESNKWETDFIQEPDLKAALAEQTILLRLKAGSQEAGYLAAIFPLPKTPTFVVIQNGELKEYLAAGVTREEFIRRMGVVLGSRVVESPPSQDSQPPVSTATTSSEIVPAATSEQPSSAVPTSQPNQQAAPARRQPSAANLLAERSARLEQQEKEQGKQSKGKGKAPADSTSQGKAPEKAAPSSADMKYALMQKKRQQDAKDERARILKRVEDDKAQRRQDAAERKAISKADAESGSQSSATVSSSSRSNHPSTRSAECAVQVRLFDGSTIRSRFPSSGNLRVHVRQWIGEKQERDTPYTFKQVLTPLPNKNISISEEEETLQTLGLTPSATLILIPVDGYTSAYEGGAGGGIVYRSAAAGYNMVSSGLGMVTGALGSLLGGGAAAPAQEQHENAPSASTPSTSINVRTLRDQQRSDDQQFYNGNALNFEPRKDDDDKKED
ncbi:UBX domain-containing protein [Lachnellula subtilissima]|uniref:UBX domain-containing protein 2 n=1 Tax=Lachnellula subtilissima TaxID=602034 RepID=A0A8H8RU03_9HELO|nr:UBX domain-containing protein [Lachnellula subtilissima]